MMEQKDWHQRMRITVAGMSGYEIRMMVEIALRELVSRDGAIEADRVTRRIMRHIANGK